VEFSFHLGLRFHRFCHLLIARPSACGLALALKRLQLKILTKNFTVAIIFVKGWPPG
jgi:hypothetical protein